MATGMMEKKRDTIEELSKRVMIIARNIAEDIDSFSSPPKPDRDDILPTPSISAIDQIAENLTQTEIALEAACEAFNQLKLRIR